MIKSMMLHAFTIIVQKKKKCTEIIGSKINCLVAGSIQSPQRTIPESTDTTQMLLSQSH